MNGFEYTENARAEEVKTGRVKIVSFETRATTLAVSYNYDVMELARYAAHLEKQNEACACTLRRMAIQNETMNVALHQIIRWCDSYPTDVFGEPDTEKARMLLEAGGMTLDSISALAVRRIVSAIRGYSQAALFTIEGENDTTQS